MTEEQFIDLMQPVLLYSAEITEFNSHFKKLGNNAGVIHLGEQLLISYIELVAKSISSEFGLDKKCVLEWIDWWLYENELGTKGLLASIFNNDMKEIKTLSDLFKIITGV